VLRPEIVPYDALGDGRHKVVLFVNVLVSTRAGAPSAEIPVRVEAEWELVPADAGSVELVDAPALREQIEPLVSAGVEVDAVGRGSSLARVSVTFNRLPVGVAYDVILRAGEKEWPVGRVSAPAGVYAGGWPESQVLKGFDAEKVDVVLRPNPSAAEGTLDVLRVWNHEMVKRDVPVTIAAPRRPGWGPVQPPSSARTRGGE